MIQSRIPISRPAASAILSFILPICLLHGCSPAVPDPGEGGAGLALQSNFDPVDPELAVVSRTNGQDRLVVHGSKDAQGGIAQVRSMQYFASPDDREPAYTLELDDRGRLVGIIDSAERQFVLHYDDASQAVLVHYFEPGFAGETRTLDFSDAPQARAVGSPLKSRAHDPAVVSATGTTRTVRFYVGLSLDDNGGSFFATVPDAIVRGTTTNTTGMIIPPGRYEPTEGAYLFDVVTRIEDAEFEARECEEQLESVEAPMELSAYALTLLFGACATLTGPGCHVFFSVAAYAGLTGMLGLHASLENECASLRREAQDPTIGLVDVRVAASVPRLGWTGEETVRFNPLDDNDPVVQLGRADVRFSIPVACGGCPDGTICDGDQCVECVFPNDCAQSPWCSEDGRCVECQLDLHCRGSAGEPLCLSERCAACSTDQQCVDAGLGNACGAAGCVECESDNHCVQSGVGAACQNNQCVECTNNSHCVAATERCDLAISECVPDDGPSSDFTILAFTNTDCDAQNPASTPNACGGVGGLPVIASAAQIQLSGNAARPTITWNVPNAFTLLVTSTVSLYGLTGVTAPDADGSTSTAPFEFSSVAYGDYSRPNTEPAFGFSGPLTPENATDLQAGVIYSVTIGTMDGALATLSFRRN